MRDDADRVAESFGIVHQVRGKDDRLPPLLEVDDRVLEGLGVDRIETAERFVENHEVGVMQQRSDELHLLLHTARELVDLGEPPILLRRRERKALHPFCDATVSLARANALELGKKSQYAAHLHLLVQSPFFRQIANPVHHGGRCIRLPEQADCPFVWDNDVEDHADGRRLSGTIGAEQAVHGAARHREGECADRRVVCVSLRDAPDLEGEFGHGLPCTVCEASRIYDRAQ